MIFVAQGEDGQEERIEVSFPNSDVSSLTFEECLDLKKLEIILKSTDRQRLQLIILDLTKLVNTQNRQIKSLLTEKLIGEI